MVRGVEARDGLAMRSKSCKAGPVWPHDNEKDRSVEPIANYPFALCDDRDEEANVTACNHDDPVIQAGHSESGSRESDSDALLLRVATGLASLLL